MEVEEGIKMDSINRGCDCPVLLGSSSQAVARSGNTNQPGGPLPAGNNLPPRCRRHNCCLQTFSIVVPVPRWLRPSGALPLGPTHFHAPQGIPAQPPVQDLQGLSQSSTFKVLSCSNALLIDSKKRYWCSETFPILSVSVPYIGVVDVSQFQYPWLL